MSRPAVLVFACLASFLVLIPLSLKQPGLPMQLTGDEAIHYLMAASLAEDGDLRCDAADVTRLFDAFPFATGMKLELVRGGGQSPRYARPVVYPLLAAPFVALWGARGLLALNALLFLAAVAIAWGHLRRSTGDAPALLFSFGFFAFSAAFVYLFRMQPQLFVMAMVTVSLGLGWPRERADPEGPPAKRRLWLSGAALALAAMQEPALVLLAVPLAAGTLRHRPRDLWSWCLGSAATLGVAALLSLAWTGSAWPRWDSPHEGSIESFTLENPLEIPWLDARPASDPAPAEADEIRGVAALLEEAGFLLWGRRTGALSYFPWLIPSILLFATAPRRSRASWTLVATIGALAALQLAVEPASRAVHDAEVGNPHLLGIYPAFLFLLTRVPRAAILAGYAVGALFLSTLLLTALGSVVPDAPLHAHTRSFPFSRLPFEYPSLGRASGFHQVELYGVETDLPAAGRLWAPADQAEVLGDDLWLLGGESVELWLESRVELPSAVFHLRNLAPGNRIAVRLGGRREVRSFGDVPSEGVTFRLEVEPWRPSRVRRDATGATYYYRLRVVTLLGEKPRWRMSEGGADYLGVGVQFLGTRAFLDRDLFALEWAGCGAPPNARPQEELFAVARLRNASGHTWHVRGPSRVRLSYRWLDAAGEEVLVEGRRTDLQNAVEPGQELAAWVAVTAPRTRGRYVLEIDPVFENVAWFSDRNGGRTCRREVEVGSPLR